jgi:hypothetical protein
VADAGGEGEGKEEEKKIRRGRPGRKARSRLTIRRGEGGRKRGERPGKKPRLRPKIRLTPNLKPKSELELEPG